MAGHTGLAKSCAKGGSDWTLRKISLLWEWSNTVPGFPLPVSASEAFGQCPK